MDRDWNVSRITREKKDTAWRQLGTSGSGNHFVEFGVMTLGHDDKQLGLDAGQYVALLSHSGSGSSPRRKAWRRAASVFFATPSSVSPKSWRAVV